jgi:polysaccharide export outer membrane protein
MQNSPFSYDTLTMVTNPHAEYLLQPNDVLSVRIKSLEVENSSFLNIDEGMNFNNFNSAALFVNGYSVNDSGVIYLPMIGAVKVGGLRVPQARDTIQRRINEYVSDASVFVNLVSFKIAVIGEVANPGYYYVYNNRLTLFEGLALAGDLREFADRRMINLVRQEENGSQTVLIDLTDPGIMKSPYYYLRPNDMLYVPPLEIKNQRSNLANLSLINTGLAAITTAVSVIVLINTLR